MPAYAGKTESEAPTSSIDASSQSVTVRHNADIEGSHGLFTIIVIMADYAAVLV
jgi:hypothetical protein